MFRCLLGAVLFTAGCGFANAAAYNDFADGVAAYERGDTARAIASLTAALNAPDLAPNLKVTAYLDRAQSYLATSQCAPANEDLKAAKALGANAMALSVGFAAAQMCVGDFKAAEASLTAAIANDQNPSIPLFRGQMRLLRYNFAGAAKDFQTVSDAAPHYPYAILWLALAQSRQSNADMSANSDNAWDIDQHVWPAPIIKLYFGRATPDDVDAAATSDDKKTAAARRCEADFFIGEWYLARNDSVSAKPRLQVAAEKCGPRTVEAAMSRMELARLK